MASSYIPPRVEIQQDFTQIPTSTTPVLSAFIVGPQFDLHRFDVPTEKPSTAVVNPTDPALGNEYQDASNVTYPYPSQAVNTTVDLDYVSVFMDNAQGEYLPNTALGSVDGNAATELFPATSGNYPNRLRYTNGSGTVLKTGNGFNRSAYLSNRDVTVGDIVNVTDNLGNKLTTTVTGLVADTYVQDGTLASKVAPKLTPVSNPTDGVTHGTNVFTSASGAFTSAFVGQVLTVNTVGSFKILAVNSATSLTISGTPAAATTLTYYVGGTYNDPANIAPVAGSSGSVTYAWTGSGTDPGTVNIDVAKAASFAYVGYASKRILTDTYTATVTTGGVLASTVFKVTSANGAFSPIIGVVPASGIIILDNVNNNLVRFDFTGSTGTFVAGQAWSVAVVAAVTMVEPVGSGTYTGATNITYKLTVVQGGPWYTGSNASTAAIVSITSSNVDGSPNVLVQNGVAFQIGNLGVMATFSAASNNGGLIMGDVYYVPATSAVLGAIKTIVLADNLPTATLVSASSIEATLSTVQNGVSIPEIRDVVQGTVNWTATEANITINSGITTENANLVVNGAPVALPVTAGNLFVQHRDLNPINSTAIGSISDASTIPAILGTIDPDNNLAQGVYEALNNSQDNVVYFIGLQSNDLAGYNKALSISKQANYVYGFVPLTFDADVQEAFANLVDGQSAPAIGRWRVAWVSQPVVSEAVLYSSQPNGQPWLATVAADPLAPTTVYSLVNVVGATFLTDGIRTGDTVFLNFRSAPDGTVIYDQYPVASVRTQTSVVLATGLPAPISIGEKFELQRTYTADEQVNNLAKVIAGFDDRRIRFVFPDHAASAGVTLEGYYIAAACAGLRSALPANQGLTNQAVQGFDDLSETVITFTDDQLNVLAEAGAFIVTQDIVGATPYIRQQLTTDMSSLNTQEESVTSNVDSVSYQLQAALKPFIGKYNINSDSVQLVKDTIQGVLTSLQTTITSATAGTQLLDGTKIVSIAQNPTFKDRLDVKVLLVVPYPYNHIFVDLVV